jgi:hypothetical protein
MPTLMGFSSGPRAALGAQVSGFHGESRIVTQESSAADQHRVAFGSQTIHPRQVVRGGNGCTAPGDCVRFSIGGHGHIQSSEGTIIDHAVFPFHQPAQQRILGPHVLQ